MKRQYLLIMIILTLAALLSACGARNVMEESESAEQSKDEEVIATEEHDAAPPSADLGPVAVLTEEEIKEFESETQTQNEVSPQNTATPFPSSSEESSEDQIVDLKIPTPNGSTEYEKYQAMSGAEQQAFFESFDDPAAFFEWLNAARDEYNALYPAVEIGNGEIDLNDYINSVN